MSSIRWFATPALLLAASVLLAAGTIAALAELPAAIRSADSISAPVAQLEKAPPPAPLASAAVVAQARRGRSRRWIAGWNFGALPQLPRFSPVQQVQQRPPFLPSLIRAPCAE